MDVTLSQDLWDDELALIVAASNDSSITEHTYLPPNMVIGMAKRWYFGHKWAYFINLDGKPVGMIVLHPKIAKFGIAEVETWLLEPYRGLGISKFGYKLIVEEAKRSFLKLTAWVWEDNQASLNILHVTGFEETGRTYEQGGRRCQELAVSFDNGLDL